VARFGFSDRSLLHYTGHWYGTCNLARPAGAEAQDGLARSLLAAASLNGRTVARLEDLGNLEAKGLRPSGRGIHCLQTSPFPAELVPICPSSRGALGSEFPDGREDHIKTTQLGRSRWPLGMPFGPLGPQYALGDATCEVLDSAEGGRSSRANLDSGCGPLPRPTA